MDYEQSLFFSGPSSKTRETYIYYIYMTFQIASSIHNLECMLTTLVSPMRAMMLKK